MSDAAFPCPRCGTDTTRGQEYCLSCGIRLPHGRRPEHPDHRARRLRIHVAALALVAASGAVVAGVLTAEDGGAETVVTALGGSVTVEAAADTGTTLAGWPRNRNGWTIVLVSVPKERGRDRATAVAQAARTRGLRDVGILDSSRFASLRPGYWMTFQGAYGSEAEATGSLRTAKAVSSGARVQQVVP